MSASWKTVRIFISSTFRDMQAERDHLARFVFPKLRDELVSFRIHLVDVDLRWGVTGDQDALSVVRNCIDECHPYFLCMIGGRCGWVPEGQDKSIVDDEVHYAVLGREPDQRGFPLFYFRDDSATARMVEETHGDFRELDGSDNARKIAALKRSIADAGLPVFIYPTQWDSAQKRLTGLEVFGDRVHADLLKCFKADPGLAARFTNEGIVLPDEFSDEAEQMEAFIEQRTERYVIGSREPLFRETLAFATGDGTANILVLTGDPGSGKSAFLAKLTRDLASLHPSRFLLPTFIGASTGSSDLPRTLRRLCHELARAGGSTEPLPLDIGSLVAHFQKLLAAVASIQRVVLIFDGLDQLDATDGAHWLNWLPRELPPDVRIIASVVAPADGQPEHQTLAILRTRLGTRLEKLELLTEADSLAVIENCLRRYAKRFSPEQLAALLAKPAGRLPLYILTALEELRTLGSYEEITDRIRALPGDARALFGWILTERLARDPGFRDREGRPCGAALVEKFAACLGVSRHGLSPAELTALLDPGDPLGNVAALLRLLRPYLMRRGELLDFSHGQFREAAGAAYLDVPEKQRAAHMEIRMIFHRDLANRFRALADPNGDETWLGNDELALTELPFHAAQALAWDLWLQVMTCFAYLKAVVEKVEVSTAATPEGEKFQWHGGYYVISGELENWPDYRSQVTHGSELIPPLLQVWKSHEVDFVKSGKQVMEILYRDLTAMEPKQAVDRASRKIIQLQAGPVAIWCEKERKKHEDPLLPWVVPKTSKWEVFISAKSADYALARQVYQFFKEHGISAFLSDESLPRLGNSDYRKEIDRALEQAHHMVVVTTSRENVESSWVEAEWGFFINEKRSGRKTGNLVTLLAGGLPPNSLPPSLRYYEALSLDDSGLKRLLSYVRS